MRPWIGYVAGRWHWPGMAGQKANPYHDEAGRFASAGGHSGGSWKPTMTHAEADAWNAGTALHGKTLFHFTSEEGESAIKKDGFKASDGILGRGIYLTESATGEDIARQWTTNRLSVAVKAERVLELKGFASLSRWMDEHAGDIDEPSEAIMRAGFDAVHYDRGSGKSHYLVFEKTKITVVDDGKSSKANPYHDQIGQFASGPGAAGVTGGDLVEVRRDAAGGFMLNDGSPAPEHVKNLGIPSNWTDVRISPDPSADLLARGRNAKGNLTSIYADSFHARNALTKFDRVRELMGEEGTVVKEINRDWSSEKPRIAEAARVLTLIHSTGMRPGSEKDMQTKEKHYGATTLEGRHVVNDGGQTRLQFVGKKGVHQNVLVEDKRMAKLLHDRARQSGPDGKLFSVSGASLLNYAKTKGKGGYLVKDFRTAKGTKEAIKMLETMPRAKHFTEYKKMVKSVARHVSGFLGNSPAMALKAYIDPLVFERIKPDKGAA